MESPCYIIQSCVTWGLTEQTTRRIKELVLYWVMEAEILCIPSLLWDLCSVFFLECPLDLRKSRAVIQWLFLPQERRGMSDRLIQQSCGMRLFTEKLLRNLGLNFLIWQHFCILIELSRYLWDPSPAPTADKRVFNFGVEALKADQDGEFYRLAQALFTRQWSKMPEV